MAKPQTERLGIAFLMYFFAENGWLFREQHTHDYGIDAHVEIWNDEDHPSGKKIEIQSKSGSSFFEEKNKESFIFRPEDKHVQYWLEQYLPVIIFLYDPKEKKGYWQSVSEENIKSTGKGWKIEIPKTNDFSDAKKCLQELQSLFEWQIVRIVKQAIKFANETNPEIIKSLTNAVTNLAQGKTHATESERDAAFAALRKGDLSLALSLFETEAERFEKEAKKGAEVQRNIGALAFFSDTEKSRKAYLRATQLDPDNADGFNQLGNILHLTGNPKGAIAAYENVLELGKKNANPKEVAAAYNGLGNIYKYSNNDKAVEFYKKALAIGEDSKIQAVTATACENIAVAYCKNGNFDEAIKQYEKALEINKKLGDREGMASNYLNLGTMYYDRERYTNTNSKNFDVAIQYLNDALDISESLKDQEKIAIIYGTLGNIYKKCNDFDKAIDYFNNALKINEDLGRKEGIAVQYENLGNLWITKDLDKAFAYFNDALKINESLEIKSRIALDYANMGLVRKRQNKYAEARQYWQQSIVLDSQHTATVQHWLNALPE